MRAFFHFPTAVLDWFIFDVCLFIASETSQLKSYCSLKTFSSKSSLWWWGMWDLRKHGTQIDWKMWQTDWSSVACPIIIKPWSCKLYWKDSEVQQCMSKCNIIHSANKLATNKNSKHRNVVQRTSPPSRPVATRVQPLLVALQDLIRR